MFERALLTLTILFSCQQEGCSQKPYAVNQRLHPLLCIMSNRTFNP